VHPGHPDDASVGTGGILARYAAEGVATSLVTATRGERGWQTGAGAYPGLDALGRMREAELCAAAHVLGLHEVVLLDYQDGELDRAELAEAIGQLVAHVRRARGVEVWAPLRSLGRAGLAALIERSCRHARRFAEGLAAAGYQVLNDVVLNQALVSFGDAETTNRVIAASQADGTWRCGGTIWQGQTAMRISVSSGATTDEDVERSLAVMVRIAARYSNPA
jgi:hypothetical protein